MLRCWPTPIYRRQMENCGPLNTALRAYILAKASGHAGAVTTNVGAWHSGVDARLLLQPCFSPLAGWIREAADTLLRVIWAGTSPDAQADEYAVECWSLVYRADDYQHIHIHHGSVWSGVYYVSAEPSDAEVGSGAIEFLDPRWAARERARATYSITPSAGLLLVFPSWLQHWVPPVASLRERICVAFNVGIPHDN